MKSFFIAALILASSLSVYANETQTTSLSAVSCKTQIIEARGRKIQLALKLNKLIQFTVFANKKGNEYQSFLEGNAIITGKGKGSVTMTVDGETQSTKEDVRILVESVQQDSIENEQFINAGLSQVSFKKVKLVRAYELSSSVLPVAELLDAKGKVLFRYVSAEVDGIKQYIWACK